MPAKLTPKKEQNKPGVIDAGIDEALKVLFVTPKPAQPTPPPMSNNALLAVTGMLTDPQGMFETGPGQDEDMMEADTVDNTIKEAFNTASRVLTEHDQFVLAMKASMETYRAEKTTEEDQDLLRLIDGMQF